MRAPTIARGTSASAVGSPPPRFPPTGLSGEKSPSPPRARPPPSALPPPSTREHPHRPSPNPQSPTPSPTPGRTPLPPLDVPQKTPTRRNHETRAPALSSPPPPLSPPPAARSPPPPQKPSSLSPVRLEGVPRLSRRRWRAHGALASSGQRRRVACRRAPPTPITQSARRNPFGAAPPPAFPPFFRSFIASNQAVWAPFRFSRHFSASSVGGNSPSRR